jgi:hypothetical protein
LLKRWKHFNGVPLMAECRTTLAEQAAEQKWHERVLLLHVKWKLAVPLS